MKYQVIHSVIWDDDKFRRLSLAGKTLWFYMLTNSRCNAMGLYILRKGTISDDTNLKDKELEAAFKELTDSEMILWDQVSGLLMIKNRLKYSPINSPTVVVASRKEMAAFPKSYLITEFLKHIEGTKIISLGHNKTLAQMIRDLIEGNGEMPPGPPGPEEDKAREKKEEEEERKREAAWKEKYEAILQHWNEICGELLPRIQSMTEKRKEHVRARLKEYPLDEWPKIFARVARSRFLTGENDKGWRADFDWVINPNNMIKIVEGKYDDRKNVQPPKRGMDALKEMAQEMFGTEERNGRRGMDSGNDPDNQDL